MFERADLSLKMSAQEHDSVMPPLRKRLGELQRAARVRGIPAMIVFEGGHASGKGEQINRLILPLDPRGFDVYAIESPEDAEAARPLFWRFWVRTPAQGRIAVFSHSWYHRTMEECREKNGTLPPECVDEINYFERLLSYDGCVIVKFFLLISKKEQKERYKKLEADPATAWLMTEAKHSAHKRYDEYLAAMDSLIEKTDTAFAPWTIVEAEDRRFAEARIFSRTIEAFERALADLPAVKTTPVPAHPAAPDLELPLSYPLGDADITKALPDDVYHKELRQCQARVRACQCEAFRKRVPIIVLFEGWDAAGKGGCIKRLTESLDPRRYSVVPVGAPSDIERKFNYLWRFWLKVPEAGHFTIYDRSWYGRVLVERVEGLCSPDELERAYGEINEMEEQIASSGAVMAKLWLHIDKETQLERFKSREADPYRRWKITEDDWRNRAKWDEYVVAVDEMLRRTSTTYAPWTIVESNDKNYSRIKTLKTVIAAVENVIGPVGR
jgi:polyphosphate:AMP phosphotransferase